MKCENQGAKGKHPLAAGMGLLLVALCSALLLAACGGVGGGGTTADTPQVKTTGVTWDSANQKWVDTPSVKAATGSSSSSTLVVELPPEEAVKQVVVRDV